MATKAHACRDCRRDPMFHVKDAAAAMEARRTALEAAGIEECVIVVGYASGRNPFMLLGRVSADTGGKMPNPPLTMADMQPVAFAAKMAFAKVLRARAKGAR